MPPYRRQAAPPTPPRPLARQMSMEEDVVVISDEESQPAEEEEDDAGYTVGATQDKKYKDGFWVHAIVYKIFWKERVIVPGDASGWRLDEYSTPQRSQGGC